MVLISASPANILHFERRNFEVRRCEGLPRVARAVPCAARWPLQQVFAFHVFSSFFQALRCQILWLAVIIPHFKANHSSFLHTPIMGNLPPLLPTPGKRWFPGPPDLVAAKAPLIGERLGGLLLLQVSASLQGFSGAVAFLLP